MAKSKKYSSLFVLILSLLISTCTQNLGINSLSGDIEKNEAVPNTSSNLTVTVETVDLPDPTTELEALPELTATPTLIPVEPTNTPHPEWTATPDTRLLPYQWRYWPVIPEISSFARELYLTGIAMENDPSTFSKIGDCQSEPAVFFGIYDDPNLVFTGSNINFQTTLDQFSGSFSRDSVAVVNGMTVASVFSPLWAQNSNCEGNESPLACEIRLHNPSIAIISLGTNWPAGALADFEINLRRIVEFNISEGVLPVLATKADFADEDNLINLAMATVAYEYDIPLWNFWLTVQHLPNHGIDPEQKGGSIYLIPDAWDIKSYTGLQILDQIWSTLGGQIP